MGLIKPSSQGTVDLSSITDKLTSMQEDIRGLETTTSGIVTSVGEVKTSVDSIQTSGGGTISTDLTALTTEVSNIRADLTSKIDGVGNNVLELLSKGGAAIKSIQRGVSNGSGGSNITIDINTINPDKSFVILDNDIVAISNNLHNATFYKPYLVSLSENKLVLSYSNTAFSWQVIEFS